MAKDKNEAARMGTKCWSSVLEYEKKGKVTLNEIELANRSVQSITGWLESMDDNTLLVEVLCDNHKVSLDVVVKICHNVRIVRRNCGGPGPEGFEVCTSFNERVFKID